MHLKPRLLILLVLLNAFFIEAIQSQESTEDWSYYNTSNSGIPVDRILEIEFDENGVLWMGTYLGGLVRYDGEEWTIYNTNNSDIPSNTITRLFIHHSDVWIISYNGVYGYDVTRFDGSSWQTWDQIYTANSISFDAVDNVWIASHNGLVKFDGHSFTTFTTDNTCLYQNATTSSYVDSQNDTKWIGMYGSSLDGTVSGLVKMVDTTCVVYNNTNSGFPGNNWVYEIFPDPDASHVLWINTNNGLAKLDEANWSIYRHPSSSGSEAVAIDSSGGIWIGTIFSGIGRHTDQWESFYGLPDSGVNDVEVDAQNRVWVATESKGLAVFDYSITAIPDRHVKDKFTISTLVSDQIKINWDYPFADKCLFRLHSICSNINITYPLESGESSLNIDRNWSNGLYFFTVINSKNEILHSGKIAIIR